MLTFLISMGYKHYTKTYISVDDLTHEEIVMAWPGDHCPSVSRGINASRAFGREK